VTETTQNRASVRLASWGGFSRTAELDGQVHYVDFGGPVDGPRIVLVHGLGGSHLNWCLLAPRLAAGARVLAVDLIGFGLSHPRGRAPTVRANTAMLDRFVREIAGAPAILVGNSMGGMVSIMEAVAHPESVAGLVLIDPVLPMARGARPDPLMTAVFALYALPVIGERYLARHRARASTRELVREVLTTCCADPTCIPEELIDASVALANERAAVGGLDAAFLRAARSLMRVTAMRRRYWATMRAIRPPVLLMAGEEDRLVSVRAAREAAARNPGWRFEVFPGVGHVPQLERPEAVAELIGDWLGAQGAAARRAATAPPAGPST
jgi:pimeloyl-ACP methyl ester carboxylesterase